MCLTNLVPIQIKFYINITIKLLYLLLLLFVNGVYDLNNQKFHLANDFQERFENAARYQDSTGEFNKPLQGRYYGKVFVKKWHILSIITVVCSRMFGWRGKYFHALDNDEILNISAIILSKFLWVPTFYEWKLPVIGNAIGETSNGDYIMKYKYIPIYDIFRKEGDVYLGKSMFPLLGFELFWCYFEIGRKPNV